MTRKFGPALAIALTLLSAACRASVASGEPSASAEPIIVPLWPASLAITKPELGLLELEGVVNKAGETIGQSRQPVAGRPWTFIGNVARPSMTIYPPKGRNSGAALMVFPGGGYQVLAIDLEGTEICDWATAQGMTCVVLKYRVPQQWHRCRNCDEQPVPFLPLEDAERAMRLLRHRAAAIGVDPHRIGVVGFSAGGHLVTAISNARGTSYRAVDAADAESVRPSFAIALYPGHLWSGEGVALHDYDRVEADAPPTLLIQAQDDPTDDVRHSVSYFLALKEKGVPAEMHLFAQGGHAFGARRTSAPITHWPDLATTWLRSIGMLPTTPERPRG